MIDSDSPKTDDAPSEEVPKVFLPIRKGQMLRAGRDFRSDRVVHVGQVSLSGWHKQNPCAKEPPKQNTYTSQMHAYEKKKEKKKNQKKKRRKRKRKEQEQQEQALTRLLSPRSSCATLTSFSKKSKGFRGWPPRSALPARLSPLEAARFRCPAPQSLKRADHL